MHADSCANGAGGHYQSEEGGAVDAENEAWPAVTDGTGSSANDWAADMSVARSVVVHDLASRGKPKMLCADLALVDQVSNSLLTR